MRQFETESKRILDMMINSVYTHREIFLRELISNASDAIDKLSYRTPDDYAITITPDKDSRTLIISDNGCGMSETDLAENLGVIAHSGTKNFQFTGDKSEDVNLIGQFGVGFYSAFMVAARVTVLSRAEGSEQGYLWASSGVDGYTLEPADKPERGTTITLYLKDNTEDDEYDEFLEDYQLKSLVKRYSDYIRYPIKLGEETLNSMTPLWKRPKSELTDADYNAFYKDKFSDWQDPQLTVHYKTEGAVTYNALLFIPQSAPPGFYSKEYQKGLKLYTNGVLIQDRCEDLLSDTFSFVKGLADSADLSLNISREILQHDRQLRAMAKSIEKKIRGELEKLLRDDRPKYEEFFKNFGLQLKYGVYNSFGANSEEIRDLLLFRSMKDDKLITLKEYAEGMPEDQKAIYYVSAETPAKAALLPQTERLRAKGFDVLILTEYVDEFAIKMLGKYDEKDFKSVSGDEIELSEDEKQKQQEQTDTNKELLDKLKESLGDKVERVIISARLTSHPVCLTSEGDLSLEMEKVLNAMPIDASAGVKAKRVLELNADHPVFAALKNSVGDGDRLTRYANLLYTQALLIEGMKIEDPVAFSNDICSLMV